MPYVYFYATFHCKIHEIFNLVENQDTEQKLSFCNSGGGEGVCVCVL